VGWNFSDSGFHDTGTSGPDVGRGALLPVEAMQHAFKTPGLREIDLRGPHMHEGSEATLKDVIEFYDLGGRVHSDWNGACSGVSRGTPLTGRGGKK